MCSDDGLLPVTDQSECTKAFIALKAQYPNKTSILEPPLKRTSINPRGCNNKGPYDGKYFWYWNPHETGGAFSEYSQICINPGMQRSGVS